MKICMLVVVNSSHCTLCHVYFSIKYVFPGGILVTIVLIIDVVQVTKL